MGRKRRAQFPGAAYHLTARGNNRQDIFLDDHDRYTFLEMLPQAVDRFDLRIYAYCLMTNHYHLFLRTRQPNLARAMHWLNNTYTKRFLVRHQRSGHLFQGRYKSVVLANDAHWTTLTHYVHLNPVRAGIVADPASYKWSSFLDYTRPNPRYDWLEQEWILSRYGSSPVERRRRYREACLMHSKKKPDFWQDLLTSIMLAADEKKEKFLGKGGKKSIEDDYEFYVPSPPPDPEEELEKIARAFNVDKQDLLARRRNFTPKLAAFYHLARQKAIPQTAVARLLNVSPAAISNGIQRLEKLMEKDKAMEKIIKELR